MKYFWEIILFLTGAIIMILELVGSRVLAPYLGMTVVVWANLIGVILGSLSIGYWCGGLLADKNIKTRNLSIIFLLAAIFIGLVALLKDFLLYPLCDYIQDVRWRAFFASLILFAIPGVLLGMVSPYIAKLRIKDLETSGKTVGNLYAISTAGFIFGCFLTAFFLIPYFGSTKILLFSSSVLLLIAIVIFSEKYFKSKIFVFLVVLGICVQVQWDFVIKKHNIIDVETMYNRVWIHYDKDKNGDNIKVMRLNNEGNTAMYLYKDELVHDYLKFYQLAKHFKPDFQKTLMIGGAGYSYPKFYLKKFPEALIDVVEIDPGVTKLAKQYFRLKDSPRLRIYHEDGRAFLNHTKNKYDAILIDAFKSSSVIPFQLTTREAVERIHDRLEDDGVVLLNVISSIEGASGEILRAEYATYKSVFSKVYLFLVDNAYSGEEVQSVMIAALKATKDVSFKNEDPVLNEFLRHLWKKDVEKEIALLTDDYAPVEYLVGKAVLK